MVCGTLDNLPLHTVYSHWHALAHATSTNSLVNLLSPHNGLMFRDRWSVLVSCYVMTFLGVFTHWLGHKRVILWFWIPFLRSYIRRWFKAHMGHHIHDYPPSRFLSDSYSAAKEDNTVAYIPCLLVTPIIMMALVGQWSVFAFLVYGIPPAMMLVTFWNVDDGHPSRRNLQILFILPCIFVDIG